MRVLNELTPAAARRLRRGVWVLFCGGLFVALAWAYHRYIWSLGAPTLRYVYEGVDYQLLHPRRLGAFLLAPWFLLVLGWTLADLPWLQRALSVLFRMGLVAALSVALARPVRTDETNKVTTVYLVDVSLSVPDEALGDAQKVIDEAYRLKRKDDLIRVVTFSRHAKLIGATTAPVGDEPPALEPPTIARHGERSGAPPAGAPSGTVPVAAPSPKSASGAFRDQPGAGSNLQAALQLAYGLYPSGYLRRAVLLSDGLQTKGDILAEANRAAEHDVKIHTVPYTRPVPGEVALRGIEVPERLKVGQTFPITADVYASRRTKVTARLKQGETLNGLEPLKEVELKPGDNKIEFKSVVRVAGEVTYDLDLTPEAEEQDRFAANNRYSVTVEVPGRPQVLFVDSAPRYAQALARALTAQQFDVDVRPPEGFPTTLKEIERFDFVILSDTPKERVSVDSQTLLEQYVRDLGGGFLFAGGDNGFGLGGWYRTPVARMLPVRMESERRKEMPSVAMALVIDRSGSMTGLPMDMAKKAAKATLDVLQSDDVLEVIAFDSSPHRYVKMQPARNRSRIRAQISRIEAGGGTDIFSALDAAYNDMTVTQARKKHVILLTDGRDNRPGMRDLATAMVAESITVTTVGLGGDVDEQLLRMIADVGGGRFHSVPDAENLPRIFTSETEMIAKEAAVEEWFPVVQTGYANFLRRIDVRTAPYLRGYVATQMKPHPATELLASADTEEPILARWRVGTGWSLAWTSDIKPRWSYDWISWPGFEKFWGQLVREHMRQKSARELDMNARIVDDTLIASVDAFTIDDRFDNELQSELSIIGPAPSKKAKKVPFKQIAPGRYEARTPLPTYGSFVLKATHNRVLEDGRLQKMASSSGKVSNPYPREFASFETDVDSLRGVADATEGQFKPENMAVAFDPEGQKITFDEQLWFYLVMGALGLFLLDLLLRRIRIFDRKFKPGRDGSQAFAG